MNEDCIAIGTVADETAAQLGPKVVCQDPVLLPHITRPWFRAALARNHGISPTADGRQQSVVAVDAATLARHAFVVGATGSGKSRLMELLVREQLRQGVSAIVLDPKWETIAHLIGHLNDMGFAPEKTTIMSPRLSRGCPGWNPFAAGLPITQATADFVGILARSTTSWGPRMADALTNALLIISSHGLSLFELTRFLTRDDYRTALLALPASPVERQAYREAVAYFADEFGAWSRSERVQAVAPITNKVRELVRSSFLFPMLCARHNSLNLAALWQRQHVVLVHLDPTTLGDEGARLLGGLLTNMLFRTALRAPGPVPVCLAVDELATVERFAGAALVDIVTVARSQNLRLLVACQHLAGISDDLRSALLANAAFQSFFRLGQVDAHHVAGSLAAGVQHRLARLTVSSDRRSRADGAEIQEMRHRVLDDRGRPMRLCPDGWSRLLAGGRLYSDGVRALRELAATSAPHRLYVRAADRDVPVEIGRYTAGLPSDAVRVEGPSPLELIVRFPRFRVSGTERVSASDVAGGWMRVLQDLPVQHAVVRVAGGAARITRVKDVPLPSGVSKAERYVLASTGANGQSPDAIDDIVQWRQGEIDRLVGRTSLGWEDASDGSLA